MAKSASLEVHLGKFHDMVNAMSKLSPDASVHAVRREQVGKVLGSAVQKSVKANMGKITDKSKKEARMVAAKREFAGIKTNSPASSNITQAQRQWFFVGEKKYAVGIGHKAGVSGKGWHVSDSLWGRILAAKAAQQAFYAKTQKDILSLKKGSRGLGAKVFVTIARKLGLIIDAPAFVSNATSKRMLEDGTVVSSGDFAGLTKVKDDRASGVLEIRIDNTPNGLEYGSKARRALYSAVAGRASAFYKAVGSAGSKHISSAAKRFTGFRIG